MASKKSNSTSFMIAVDGSKHAEEAFRYYYAKLHCPVNKVRVVHAAEVPSRTTYTYNGNIHYYDKIHRQGNQVKVVHAAEVPSRTTYSYSANIPPMTIPESEWQKVLADHMTHIKKLEKKYQEMCAKQEPPCEVETVHTSHPGAGLVHYAKDHKVDQVVIGTRGMNTFRRTFLGSVSDYVLHHLHKPITVVPAP